MPKNEPKADWRLQELLPPCFYCQHLNVIGSQQSLTGWSCSAFPEGIPYVILTRQLKHDQTIFGQEGEKVYKSKTFDFPDGFNWVTFEGEWGKKPG